MLSVLSDAEFSRTTCTSPLVAPTGTICVLSDCFTAWMNLSIQSAPPCWSLCFVGITTAYSWAWRHNTHCWVIMQLFEKVDSVFPVGRGLWHWSIWVSGVQLRYNSGYDGTPPWKEWSRSLSIFCTQKLWDSGGIPFWALEYCRLQFSPRCSTDGWQWNSRRLYNCTDECLIKIMPLSTIWSYLSCSPLTSCPQFSSTCSWKWFTQLGIPKSSDAFWSEVNSILLYSQRTEHSVKECTYGNTGWKNGSSWQWWKQRRWALWMLYYVLVADSRFKLGGESIVYQPVKAT